MPFPAGAALVPAGVVVMYLLNAVRIAALILIGSAGAREIAVGGFHSQAGWIAFNVVALGFSVAARRTPYFTLNPPRAEAETRSADVTSDNPTAAYLVPFLVILGAGMVSGALSGSLNGCIRCGSSPRRGRYGCSEPGIRIWTGEWGGWDQRSGVASFSSGSDSTV